MCATSSETVSYLLLFWQQCIDLTGLATPPPDARGNFGPSPPKQNAKIGGGFLNPGRSIPPRVDISAASEFPFSLESECTTN
jgi:hypothetical protein